MKAHRTASSLRVKRLNLGRPDRAHQGWHEHKAPCRYRCEWPPLELLHARSAIISVQRHCWTNCPRRNGCSPTGGYDADSFRDALQAKGIEACIPGRNRATSRSNTTSAGTNGETASRSCSAASKTGAGSPRATTDARRPSSPRSHSRPPSSSGSDQ